MQNEVDTLKARASYRRWAPTVLMLLVVIVYGQTVFYPAITFDDPLYTWQEPHIGGGLSVDGIAWAFSDEASESHANWIPLTFLSLMLDADVYGDWAGGYHLTNLLLHAANSVLLYFTLVSLSRASAKSFVVAAIFAVHPLHVESVAWISERKDVLSTLFGLSALLSYSRWMQLRRARFYWRALLLFVFSLMSKQTLVTFPCLLLLLDLCPLNRNKGVDDSVQSPDRQTPLRLIAEKLPFLLLTIAFSIGVYLAQGIAKTDALGLPYRLANAAIAGTLYVWRTVWPTGLSIFYPHPLQDVSVALSVGCGLFLIAVSAAAFWKRKQVPSFFTGWFWFFGTLVPMIGIVQVGEQQMADRYMYFPQIGLSIVFVWSAATVLSKRLERRHLQLVTGLIIALMTVLGARQTHFWQDSETLYSHAVRSTRGNYKAHQLLGSLFYKQDDIDRAIEEYEQATLYRPTDPDILAALGAALARKGRIDEAHNILITAIRIAPEHPAVRVNMGVLLDMIGRQDEAIEEFQRALESAPRTGIAHRELGRVLGVRGETARALSHLRKATAYSPNDAESWCHLGIVLTDASRFDEAGECFSQALRLKPDLEPARMGVEFVREQIQKPPAAP